VETPRGTKRPAEKDDKPPVEEDYKPKKRGRTKATKAKLSEYNAGRLNGFFGKNWFSNRLETPAAEEFYGAFLCFLKGLPLKKTAKADSDFLAHVLQSPIVKGALNDPEACKDALKQYRIEISANPYVKANFEDALKQYRRLEDIVKDLESEVNRWRMSYVEMVDIAGKECNNVDDLVYAIYNSAYDVQFWELDHIKDYEWGLMGEAAKRLVNPTNGDEESTDEEDK